MAVVLADVVVVKRCKEEQTTLHLSLYDRSSRFSPLYIHKVHINISSPSPSLQLSLPPSHQGQLCEYTTQQPSTHQTAYTCKRQTFTATCLKYSSTINPSRSIKQPQNIIRPPPPHFGSLAQIISRKAQTKNKMQGGRAEFKKTSRVQCMPPPRGVSAKKTRNVTQGLQ